MPAKRRKITAVALHKLTMAQESHLEVGIYFWDFAGEIEHFRDERQRRAAWAAHRERILARYDRAGSRPLACWQLDFGIEGDYRDDMAWPAGIASEAHYVHTLLTQGKLEPLRRGSWWREPTELAEIERLWHELVGQGAGMGGNGEHHACGWGGVPKGFWREHSPPLIARAKAESEAFRARIQGYGRAADEQPTAN